MANTVEKTVGDFVIWARVRAIDLARAAGMTRQNINYHNREDSETIVRYDKRTNEFQIIGKNGSVFGS